MEIIFERTIPEPGSTPIFKRTHGKQVQAYSVGPPGCKLACKPQQHYSSKMFYVRIINHSEIGVRFIDLLSLMSAPLCNYGNGKPGKPQKDGTCFQDDSSMICTSNLYSDFLRCSTFRHLLGGCHVSTKIYQDLWWIYPGCRAQSQHPCGLLPSFWVPWHSHRPAR